ncbi:MAG: hypothetical protein J1F60_02630 [Oscillospiraceae bacterium]|nr:hypothetical protein [Oscillospiraceae bacterium]
MKRLLNKRGSVLFLVVVVMALLLVAASATYYVVRNQHASANAHYNSEQSYQTAYSVSDVLENYLASTFAQISSNPSAYNGSLFQKIMNMGTGEANALTAGNDFSEYGLGEYDIKIVKSAASTSDEAVFEVIIKSNTNGETTTLTQVWKIALSPSETKYFTRFLTTTGVGVLEDTYIQCQRIYGEAYFENEFTVINNPARVNRSVYSAGTLIDTGWEFENTADKEVVIADNYYLDGVAGHAMEMKQIFVGADMYDKSTKPIYAQGVYVLGDFTYESNGNSIASTVFVKGNCYIKGYVGANANFYVDGDLHLGRGSTAPWNRSMLGTVYVKGDVYFDDPGENGGNVKIYYGGNVYGNKGSYAVDMQQKDDILTTTQAALTSVSGGLVNSWNEVALYISNQTAVGTYQVWDAESLFEAGGDYADAPTINFKAAADANGYNTGKTTAVGNSGKSYVEYVTGGSGSGFRAIIKESCRIVPAPTGGWGTYCYIFDATDEDIYVYLDSNGNKGDNGEPLFQFFTNWASANSVYVTGTHSVIFVLPVGTDFKGSNQTFIGHYDLAHKIYGLEKNFNGLGVDWQSAMTSVDAYNAKLGDAVFKTVTDDEGTEYRFLDSTKFGGAKVHNNVFLVCKDSDNTIDFNVSCMLAGYIYAPNVRMDIGSGAGGMTQFFGGLIVGSYKYINTSAILAFCSPYDPYNIDPSTGEVVGGNVVSNLISKANGGVLQNGGGGSGGAKDVSIEFLGYR